MSTGAVYRAAETTITSGDATDLALEGVIGSAWFTLVDAVKAMTGIGTGPWEVDVTVEDGVDVEIIRCDLEEGTGPGGKDLLKRTTGTILASSNGGAAVLWGSNVKNVFLCPAADKLYALFDALSTAGYLRRVSATSFAVQATPIPINHGGTNAVTAATARASLVAQLDVISARGDVIRGSSANIAERLAKGAANTFLGSDGTDTLFRTILAAWITHTPTAPVTGVTVQSAIDQLSHAFSSTVQAATQDNIGTSIVAVSDLDNLSIPGTGDSSKKYRCIGQVTIGGITNNIPVVVKVHVGTNGTTADAVVGESSYFRQSFSTPHKESFAIPTKVFTPGATDKVTISVTVGTDANTDIVADAEETFVTIEQISNA